MFSPRFGCSCFLQIKKKQLNNLPNLCRSLNKTRGIVTHYPSPAPLDAGALAAHVDGTVMCRGTMSPEKRCAGGAECEFVLALHSSLRSPDRASAGVSGCSKVRRNVSRFVGELFTFRQLQPERMSAST